MPLLLIKKLPRISLKSSLNGGAAWDLLPSKLKYSDRCLFKICEGCEALRKKNAVISRLVRWRVWLLGKDKLVFIKKVATPVYEYNCICSRAEGISSKRENINL